MDYQHVLFDPNGRIGQRDFWIGVLILIAANWVVGFVPFIGFLLSLGLIYVGVCVYGKRLHDAGRSAWWHALPWAISLVLIVRGAIAGFNAIATLAASDPELYAYADPWAMLESAEFGALFAMGMTALFWFAISWLVWIVYTIWVGASVGNPESNTYGPPPGQVEAGEETAAKP